MSAAAAPTLPGSTCAVAAAPRPDRLAPWLGHGVTPTLCVQIAAVPRLAGRTARLVENRLGLPAALSPGEASALSLDLLGLAALSWWAGVAWHARALAALIDGCRIRALADQAGPDIRRLGLRWLSVAPPDIPAVPTDRLVVTALEDGAACLEAWCDAKPPPVGRRIALRLPLPPVRPDPLHRQHGPGLIDSLLLAGHVP